MYQQMDIIIVLLYTYNTLIIDIVIKVKNKRLIYQYSVKLSLVANMIIPLGVMLVTILG